VNAVYSFATKTETRVDDCEERIGHLSEQGNQAEHKIEAMAMINATNIEANKKRLDTLESRMSDAEASGAGLHGRIGKLEGAMSGVKASQTAMGVSFTGFQDVVNGAVSEMQQKVSKPSPACLPLEPPPTDSTLSSPPGPHYPCGNRRQG